MMSNERSALIKVMEYIIAKDSLEQLEKEKKEAISSQDYELAILCKERIVEYNKSIRDLIAEMPKIKDDLNFHQGIVNESPVAQAPPNKP